MSTAVISFDRQGDGHCLYTEAVDLSSIGHLEIKRATMMEFNNGSQQWEVRHDGKLLFQNPSRAICLAWEQQHFSR
jgi:hypothetical protein